MGLRHAGDLLLGNCWTGFDTCARVLRPGICAIGHENDLGHPHGLRPSFKRTFRIMDETGIAPPWTGPEAVVLTWGEGFSWQPPTSPRTPGQ